MKFKNGFGITALTAVIGLACGSGNKSDDAKTIKVGVMTKSDSEENAGTIQNCWKDNIKLKFTEFAVLWQIKRIHDVKWISMLSTFPWTTGTRKTSKNLVATAETYISPIRLYSGTKMGKINIRK